MLLCVCVTKHYFFNHVIILEFLEKLLERRLVFYLNVSKESFILIIAQILTVFVKVRDTIQLNRFILFL